VVQTFFSFYKDDPATIRNDPARGGGALLDIGCYPVLVARWLFGAEPRRVLALVEYDPRFGVDRLTSAVLDFGTGTGTFTCSTQLASFQQVQVVGTEGRVELSEVPCNAANDRPCVIRLGRGGTAERIEVEVCDPGSSR
jgi:predicted dehydrogenase